MNPLTPPKILITDLDNTLYSWVEFIVPALEAMTKAIVAATDLPENQVAPALQEVYSDEDTTDYAFVLQKSRLFSELNMPFEEFNRQIIQPAKLAYRQARDTHLKEYQGVTDTLTQLGQEGITIVGLTDAPFFPAEQRLKSLNLDQFLHGLYAMRSYHLPTGEKTGEIMVDPVIVEKHKSGAYRSILKQRVEMDPSWEKPDPRGVQQILSDYQVNAQDAWYVGDHPVKDAQAAERAGVRFFHAAFGRTTPKQISQKLAKFSPPSLQNRHSIPPGTQTHLSTYSLENFGQLLSFFHS